MQPLNQLRQRLIRSALSTATLVSSVLAPMAHGLTPAVYAAPTPAKSADAFVDSMCINTHLGYTNTPYGNFDTVKQRLVELGMRHIRDGGSREDIIAKMKQLAALGIKTNYIMNPQSGVAPNSSYWVIPTEPSYYINDFVKNRVGTDVIDAVEVLNEIDGFHNLNGGYYWHPGDTQKINNDPNSPFYWASYARSLTQDTWTALKSDPATANIKVIGPSLGRSYGYSTKSPLSDLNAYVDWGNFHPYPYGGNGFNYPFSYNTIDRYYWQGNFPAVNIDEYPYAFDVYKPPFGSKPMAATETGYFTSKTAYGISENMHGKYMPRIFAEYFRKGIIRTCSYEFLDQSNNPSNKEANFGLLRNDLSPKPAYTTLKKLIGLLTDPGISFTPSSLDYELTVSLPSNYKAKYVHDLLLQKRDGTFYLVLWHEISNGDTSSTPVREITPPNIATQIRFNTPISSATLYQFDDSGNMSSADKTISNNTISTDVTDKIKVYKLTPRK